MQRYCQRRMFQSELFLPGAVLNIKYTKKYIQDLCYKWFHLMILSDDDESDFQFRIGVFRRLLDTSLCCFSILGKARS